MAAPVRIVRIIPRLNIGGPSIHAALLSNGLDPSKFSTCLVVGEPDATEGDLRRLIQGERVRLVQLSSLRRAMSPWNDLRSLVRLLTILWRERPRIIHTHMAKAGALGRFAGVLYNRVGPGRRLGHRAILIHTFHGHVLEGYFPLWLSRLFTIIERWLARRTDGLIAVSPAVQRELMEKGIGRREQWRLIPLGLDLSTLGQLPLPNGARPVRVGFVGRLVPIKNPSLFLQALGRIQERRPDLVASGVMVGDGPLRRPLEQEADRLGLRDLLRFAGWQHDLSSVYERLEIVCLTSWNEGTPVSLIEAMAAGRAVVATDVGGVRDLLEGSADEAKTPIASGGYRIARRGLIVRAGDPDGLASALDTLASDAALRRTLGEAARSYAVQAFRQERLLQGITSLYDQLLTEAHS